MFHALVFAAILCFSFLLSLITGASMALVLSIVNVALFILAYEVIG